MFPVSKAPQYLAETRAAVARLEESTTPEPYAALRARAERLVAGLFTVLMCADCQASRGYGSGPPTRS